VGQCSCSALGVGTASESARCKSMTKRLHAPVVLGGFVSKKVGARHRWLHLPWPKDQGHARKCPPKKRRCAAQVQSTTFLKDLIHGSSTLSSTPVLAGHVLQLATQLRWQGADMDEPLLALGVEVMSVLEAAADSGHFCGPEPLLDADLAAALACNILSTFGTVPPQRSGRHVVSMWPACGQHMVS
jgi:hypothetical protein